MTHHRIRFLCRVATVSLTGALCAVLSAGAGAQTATTTTKLYNTGDTDKTYGYQAGARNFDTSGNGMSVTSDNFWAYCIDRDTGFGGGITYTKLSGLDAYLTTANSAFGGKTYYQQQMSSGNYSSTGSYGDSTTPSLVKTRLEELFRYAYADSLTSTLKSAAFQFSVWEVLGDASLSRTSGFNSAAVDTSFNSQVDTYLTALGTHSWGSLVAKDYNFTVYMALGQSQGQISVTPGTGSTNGKVPEPGSLALAMMAVLMLAGQLRRRRSPGGQPAI